MNPKTVLSASAILAVLFAVPAVAADVDVSAQPVYCQTAPPIVIVSPPWLEPRIVVEDCGVSVHSNAGPSANCPPVGPFPWLHPYVRVDSDCSITVRA
jgi:hypothetical protein